MPGKQNTLYKKTNLIQQKMCHKKRLLKYRESTEVQHRKQDRVTQEETNAWTIIYNSKYKITVLSTLCLS